MNAKFTPGAGRWVNKDREYVYPNFWRPFVPLMEVMEGPGAHDSVVLENAERVVRPSLQLRATE